jgi:putative PIN family toxin of toxin-antitoxin system
MLALRLVIDTNIVVAAALNEDGLQRTVLLIATTKPARLYVSEPIMEEYSRALARPHLQISKGLRQQLLQLIKSRSHLVVPRGRIEGALDPDDNMFVECADAARADYLVTGNLKHFPKFWKNTKVIAARDFVSLAAPHLQR